MNQKQPRDGSYFEMPLLSKHQVKELGQNLLTSRNCHSKFLFLWWILTDIPVILTMNHGAETKSPQYNPAKRRQETLQIQVHCPRDWRVFEFLVSKRQGEDTSPKYHHPAFSCPIFGIFTRCSPSLGIHLNCLCFTQKSLNTLP